MKYEAINKNGTKSFSGELKTLLKNGLNAFVENIQSYLNKKVMVDAFKDLNNLSKVVIAIQHVSSDESKIIHDEKLQKVVQFTSKNNQSIPIR